MEGSLTLNPDGEIIRFGKSLEAMLGYSAEDVLGRPLSVISPVSEKNRHRSMIENAKGHGPVSGTKTRLVKKDGSEAEVYASVYPLRDRSGDLYSLIFTIDAHKTTEIPAILTEEFQRMFKFSNDAVIVTDKDGSIIDVNQSFLDTYGYRREEVLGSNPRILRSQHSTKDLYEKMWKDILDPRKGYWRGEIINLTRDYNEVPVLLSINAIKDSNGAIKNFLGIAFNMSQLKELDRIKKMYVDFIVHDMRGPLTTIMVNSDLLQSQVEALLPDKAKRRLTMIYNCTQRLNNMTSDILDYSKIKSGIGLFLKKERVSVAKAVRDAAVPFEGLEKKLYLNGVRYPCELEENTIDADADKLQRIIYNLLSNAFKHAMSEVRMDVKVTGAGLRATVTDDGRGMDPKDAERIFEAFFQTEEGIRTGGAGLGLSIVKCFVEAHGGDVWVEPGPGKGATFGFYLPG